MVQRRTYRWHAYKRFYLVLLLGAAMTCGALLTASKGDVISYGVLLLGVVLTVVSAYTIWKNGVWVQIDKNGVSFRNVFVTKTLLWHEITQSYLMTVRLVHFAYIQTCNGQVRTLPITGRDAKEIVATITDYLQENNT